MMPTFINVMQIYSMANLHDISWGNRPSANTGVESVTYDKEQQNKLREDYKMYRAFVFISWILSNCAFGIGVRSILNQNFNT